MWLGNVSKCCLLMRRRQSRDYEDQRGSLKLKVCIEQQNFNFHTMLHQKRDTKCEQKYIGESNLNGKSVKIKTLILMLMMMHKVVCEYQ